MQRRFIPSQFNTEGDDGCSVCLAVEPFEQASMNLDTALVSYQGCLVSSFLKKQSSTILPGVPLPEDKHSIKVSSADALHWFELTQAVIGAFHDMVSHYRASFLLDLAIYYTVEASGRESKATNFILAYDECRAHVEQREQEMTNCFTALFEFNAFMKIIAAEGLFPGLEEMRTKLLAAYNQMNAAAVEFWQAVDAWSDHRRQKAFNLLN